MAKSTAPSFMSNEQVDKAGKVISRILRTNRENFKRDVVQRALGHQKFGENFRTWWSEQVNTLGNLIVKAVNKVNRDQTPEWMLNTPGFKMKYVATNVVIANIPRGIGNDEMEAVFFPLVCEMSREDAEKKRESLGLLPCDLYTLAEINKADPHFAKEHPNFVQWKDGGKWHCIFFSWVDELRVSVRSDMEIWGVVWWGVGLRKK